jgi:hypothetical protein
MGAFQLFSIQTKTRTISDIEAESSLHPEVLKEVRRGVEFAITRGGHKRSDPGPLR